MEDRSKSTVDAEFGPRLTAASAEASVTMFSFLFMKPVGWSVTQGSVALDVDLFFCNISVLVLCMVNCAFRERGGGERSSSLYGARA